MHFDLARFVTAQDGIHRQALAELRAGRKTGHWMWFVFPQLAGLGLSPTSIFYAIRSAGEARAYLAHQLLGPRLEECTAAMLAHRGRRADEILGAVDALKFRSSMTLFDAVAPGGPFGEALDAFYGGARDPRTLELFAA